MILPRDCVEVKKLFGGTGEIRLYEQVIQC